MYKMNKYCNVLGLSLGLAITLGAQAGIHVFVNMPVAPAGAVMTPPYAGYERCYVVPPAYYGNVWVPAHQECQYVNSYGPPSVWVAPYWGCVAWGGGGCYRWHWWGGYWRGPAWHHGYIPHPVYYHHGYYYGGYYYHHNHW